MARLYRPSTQLHTMKKQERIEVAKTFSQLQSEKQHLMVLLAAALGGRHELRVTVDELTKLQNSLSEGKKILNFSTREGVVTVFISHKA